MRTTLRAAAVGVSLITTAALGVATASSASAMSPYERTACFGQDGKAVVCIQYTIDPTAAPTIDPKATRYLGCFFLGGTQCTDVYIPDPVVDLGSPATLITVTCGGYIEHADLYCSQL